MHVNLDNMLIPALLPLPTRKQIPIMLIKLLLLLTLCLQTTQLPPGDGSGSPTVQCCVTSFRINITSVKCDNCGFSAFPVNLPRNATSLDLSNNPLRVLMSSELHDFEGLEILLMSNCRLKYIHLRAFSRLKLLRTLDLSHNNLKNFKEATFESLHNLFELRIDNNKYYEVGFSPLEALHNVTSLRVLSLDMFNDKPLGADHAPLHEHLEEVRLSIPRTITRVIQIAKETFLISPHLKRINVTGNIYGIKSGAFKPLQNLTGLSFEDTEYMSVSAVFNSLSGIANRKMDYLYVNKVRNFARSQSIGLDTTMTQYLSTICVRHVSLAFTDIGIVTRGSMLSLRKSFRCLESIDLSGNQNIRYHDVLNMVSLMNNLKYLSLCCIKKARTKRSLSENKDNENAINIRTFQIPHTLEYLNISYNDFYSTPLYSVQALNGLNLRILDASYLNMSSCNGYIRGLPALRVFNMSSWNCSLLSINLISDMKNLTHFVARNSHLGKGFEADTKGVFLKGLKSLEYVDISFNELRQIQRSFFQDQRQSLIHLKLNHNTLTSVPDSLGEVTSLEILDISNNFLTGLNEVSRSVLESVIASSPNFKVRLADNKFLCTCHHVESFRWIMNKRSHILDIDKLTCENLNGNVLNVTDVLEDFENFEHGCKVDVLLYCVIGISLALVLVAVVVFLSYQYRFSCYYWLLTSNSLEGRRHRGQYLTDYEQEYEAYVDYSESDEDWVFGQFLVQIDQQGTGTLFLSNRDFSLKENRVGEIIEAIDKSRRIVFVVTWDFLRTKWKSLQTQLAMKHALRKKRNDRIILLLMEEIKIDEMPKVIRKTWCKFNCFSWPREEQFNNTERLNVARENFWEQVKKAVIGSFEQMSVQDITT